MGGTIINKQIGSSEGFIFTDLWIDTVLTDSDPVNSILSKKKILFESFGMICEIEADSKDFGFPMIFSFKVV